MKRSQCRLPLVTCSSKVMQWIETTLSKLATFPDIYLVTFRFVQCISAVKLLESDVLLKRLRVFSRNWSYLYYVIGFVDPGFSVCVRVCVCVGRGGACHTRRKSPAVQLHSLYRIIWVFVIERKMRKSVFNQKWEMQTSIHASISFAACSPGCKACTTVESCDTCHQGHKEVTNGSNKECQSK